jgi:hypothetical protein
MGPFEPRDLFGWHLDFAVTAEREGKQRHERAEKPDAGQPPNVPDQRKADDDCEERQ